MEQATDEKQAAITLHLLHGTWASHAAWTQPDSELVKSLQKEFGKPLPMEWKGKNRDSDRRSAAEQVDSCTSAPGGPSRLNCSQSWGKRCALRRCRS